MKRYIKASYEPEFAGYCFYKCNNADWGRDALRILQNIGGDKGYVKFRKSNASAIHSEYYSPRIVYLFNDKSVYTNFKNLLKEHDLSGFVELGEYLDFPETAVIVELG